MSEFSERIKDAYILAPLTKGGNLPFRRLCKGFGADATISEMAYARFIVKGNKRERALLRKHSSEDLFGVQFAALQPEEGIAAARIAVEAGADFIDINCGCPIDDTTRRGLGAAMLRRPKALARLVDALVKNIDVPITVKVRTGWSESDINIHEISKLVAESGAAALTIHGRTREQRYSRAADWDVIREVAESSTIPIIGNGDILTYYEAEDRKLKSGAHAMLIARGALIKPWIFSELKSNQGLDPTPEERVSIYRQLASYMKEHFGEDEMGRRRISGFLPWHFSFFNRYRPYPEEQFRERSREHPLMQTRDEANIHPDPFERLLRSVDESHHVFIANILLEAADDRGAILSIRKLADDLAAQTSVGGAYLSFTDTPSG